MTLYNMARHNLIKKGMLVRWIVLELAMACHKPLSLCSSCEGYFTDMEGEKPCFCLGGYVLDAD